MKQTDNHLLYKDLEAQALQTVARRYGDDMAARQGVPEVEDLAYHNAHHSRYVCRAAKRVADFLRMTGRDRALAGMIGAAHDVIHESDGQKTAEERSAEWLVAKMRQYNMDQEDQVIAELAIAGTTPIMSNDGSTMTQRFSQLTFPSERARLIALCVAAADMESLFAAHGPMVAHQLFKEYQHIAYASEPSTLEGLTQFQRRQVEFVGNFTPLQPEFEELFGGLRQEIVAHQAQILTDIEAGLITTWREVTARDDEFMRRHTITI